MLKAAKASEDQATGNRSRKTTQDGLIPFSLGDKLRELSQMITDSFYAIYSRILTFGGYPEVDEREALRQARPKWLAVYKGNESIAIEIFRLFPDRDDRERANDYIWGLDDTGDLDPRVQEARIEYEKLRAHLRELHQYGKLLPRSRMVKINRRKIQGQWKYTGWAVSPTDLKRRERLARRLNPKTGTIEPPLSPAAQRRIQQLKKRLAFVTGAAMYQMPCPSLEVFVSNCIKIIKAEPPGSAQKEKSKRLLRSLVPETRGGKRHYDVPRLALAYDRCLRIAKKLKEEWRATRKSSHNPEDEFIRRYPELRDIYGDGITATGEVRNADSATIARELAAWLWSQIPQGPLGRSISIKPETIKKVLASIPRLKR